MSSRTQPAETEPPEDGAVAPDDAEQVATIQDAGDGATDQLALDYVFDVLKNQRRRWVLRYLTDHEGTVTMNDIAEHIAALENDTTPRALTSRQRKRVYVGLYQCHLPKMDDIGVVDFDKNRGQIELGENADQLEQYLRLEDDDRPSWSLGYLTVSLLGLGAFSVLVLAGAQTTLTVSVVFAAVVVCVTALAATQRAYAN